MNVNQSVPWFSYRVILATYGLIHAFLKSQSLTKAADALRKSVKDVIVLHDDVKQEGPSLHEIIVEWKKLKEKADEYVFLLDFIYSKNALIVN